jgi:hypothetical protein
VPAFEELFTYACPKFIAANPPPYEDPEALQAFAADPPPEPAGKHLRLFLRTVHARSRAPTLRGFLKLYTRLDASRLAGLLDADPEEMVQDLMGAKLASRSVARTGAGGLLEGQPTVSSDLDFVIEGVRSPPSLFCAHALMAVLGGVERRARRGEHRRPPLRGLVPQERRARRACVHAGSQRNPPCAPGRPGRSAASPCEGGQGREGAEGEEGGPQGCMGRGVMGRAQTVFV